MSERLRDAGRVALAVGVLALAGCGGTYDAAVTGVVKINDKPLSGGTVKYIPDQGGASAYGLVMSDGSYHVMTGREEGLKPGPYTVTVVAIEPSTPNPEPSLPPKPGKLITPAWYRDAENSPLKKTVEPGSNEIDLELTTQPPAGWQQPSRRG